MAYGKEYKEEVLSRFHASGMSMRAACSSLEGFPCAATLSAFAREEGAGLLRPPALAVPGRCEDRERIEKSGPSDPVGQQRISVIDRLLSVMTICRCVATGEAAIILTSISASRNSMPSSPPKCWRL